MVIASIVLTFIVSFLLGSIPWGVVISKAVYKDDVREHGSGNIGTTNMMRAYGKKAGIAVFALDFAKGVVSGLLALAFFAMAVNLGGSAGGKVYINNYSISSANFINILIALSFLGCVWGHIFSPFLRFRGGKGIATAVGNEFVSITPVGAVIELAIFGVLVAATKYVSLGSIAAALACLPISMFYFWGNPVAIALMWVGALTVFGAHHENIRRLIEGTEHKIGDKGAQETEETEETAEDAKDAEELAAENIEVADAEVAAGECVTEDAEDAEVPAGECVTEDAEDATSTKDKKETAEA